MKILFRSPLMQAGALLPASVHHQDGIWDRGVHNAIVGRVSDEELYSPCSAALRVMLTAREIPRPTQIGKKLVSPVTADPSSRAIYHLRRMD